MVGEERGGGSADQPAEANSDHSQKQEVPTGRAGSRVAPAHKEKCHKISTYGTRQFMIIHHDL